MEVKFYHDIRNVKRGQPLAPLTIRVSHRGKNAYISTGIKLEPCQWNPKKNIVVNHVKEKQLNTILHSIKSTVDGIVTRAQFAGTLGSLSAADIKNKVENILCPEKVIERERKEKERVEKQDTEKLFLNRMRHFADRHSPETRTRAMYHFTVKRILDFDKDAEKLRFEDITRDWLIDFENFLAKTACKNARNILLRNIRATFNDAIDYEITSNYPFRRFKIRPEKTRKRALTVEQLRELFNTTEIEEYATMHRDMFKLMFMLIGINTIDLFNLEKIEDGRVVFHRRKTHRLYSIKVEPEALEIINRYRGKKKLLCLNDRYSNHADYAKHLNKALQRIGPVKIVSGHGKKEIQPLFPDITAYWARHTWATIAGKLDIPKETISKSLGHGSETVTDIYIDFDEAKIEAANRKVLNYVLYGSTDASAPVNSDANAPTKE